jgi:hypothetical protein
MAAAVETRSIGHCLEAKAEWDGRPRHSHVPRPNRGSTSSRLAGIGRRPRTWARKGASIERTGGERERYGRGREGIGGRVAVEKK